MTYPAICVSLQFFLRADRLYSKATPQPKGVHRSPFVFGVRSSGFGVRGVLEFLSLFRRSPLGRFVTRPSLDAAFRTSIAAPQAAAVTSLPKGRLQFRHFLHR